MESPDLDDLPRAYRIGLRLRELGADDDLIGDCLGIDPAGRVDPHRDRSSEACIRTTKQGAGRPVGSGSGPVAHTGVTAGEPVRAVCTLGCDIPRRVTLGCDILVWRPRGVSDTAKAREFSVHY